MNRSPGLAGFLSVLFPGLGHLYAGATARGLALAAVFVAVLQGATRTDEGPLVLGIIALWLFGIVNAIRTTEEMVQAHAEGRPAATTLDRSWAFGLIVAGAIATLALIPGLGWAVRLWPLVLVWIGFRLLRGLPLIPSLPDPPPAESGASGSTAGPPSRAPVQDAPLVPQNGDEQPVESEER